MLIPASRIRATVDSGGFRIVLNGRSTAESSLIARPGHMDLLIDVATSLVYLVAGEEVNIVPTGSCAQITVAPGAVAGLKQWMAERAKVRSGKAAA